MKASGRTAHPVCPVAEFPPGSRRLLEIAGRSIGIFRLEDGRFYALRNRCPHRGAPLCEGRQMGLWTAERPYHRAFGRDGEILRCPWHGWEFDLTTGRSVFMPEDVRVKSYPVGVEAAPDPSVESFDVAEREGLVVLWLGD
jgi:3-phenylpropionate/trans-cinnamate dioxygenase ferredoxin subunit